ncbi:MAG: hypothetical protein U0270_11210 [Labilithrix sp.]
MIDRFRVLMVVLGAGVAAVAACSSSDDAGTGSSSTSSTSGSPGDGGSSGVASSSSGATSSSSGSGTTSSSSSGGSTSGAPAAGQARFTATFSAPVDGYNGGTAPFAGTDDKGKAEVTSGDHAFSSVLQDSKQVRTVSVSVDGAPVQGMTYNIAATQDDFIKGNLITYQELDIATTKSRTWFCAGTVKFDSIVGKVHELTFDAKCQKYPTGSSAEGGMTMVGTGIGTLP